MISFKSHVLFSVDEEFEIVATQVLNRTQAMVNKYRRLLMVEAEVSTFRASGSLLDTFYVIPWLKSALPLPAAFQSIIRNGDD